MSNPFLTYFEDVARQEAIEDDLAKTASWLDTLDDDQLVAFDQALAGGMSRGEAVEHVHTRAFEKTAGAKKVVDAVKAFGGHLSGNTAKGAKKTYVASKKELERHIHKSTGGDFQVTLIGPGAGKAGAEADKARKALKGAVLKRRMARGGTAAGVALATSKKGKKKAASTIPNVEDIARQQARHDMRKVAAREDLGQAILSEAVDLITNGHIQDVTDVGPAMNKIAALEKEAIAGKALLAGAKAIGKGLFSGAGKFVKNPGTAGKSWRGVTGGGTKKQLAKIRAAAKKHDPSKSKAQAHLFRGAQEAGKLALPAYAAKKIVFD